jgi:hypothetical protein
MCIVLTYYVDSNDFEYFVDACVKRMAPNVQGLGGDITEVLKAVFYIDQQLFNHLVLLLLLDWLLAGLA